MWPRRGLPCYGAPALRGHAYTQPPGPWPAADQRGNLGAVSYSATTRFSAELRPSLPGVSSYSTRCPSFSVVRPACSTAEIWTNTSFDPSSGWINPNPLVGLNHFTVPVAIVNVSLTQLGTPHWYHNPKTRVCHSGFFTAVVSNPPPDAAKTADRFDSIELPPMDRGEKRVKGGHGAPPHSHSIVPGGLDVMS